MPPEAACLEVVPCAVELKLDGLREIEDGCKHAGDGPCTGPGCSCKSAESLGGNRNRAPMVKSECNGGGAENGSDTVVAHHHSQGTDDAEAGCNGQALQSVQNVAAPSRRRRCGAESVSTWAGCSSTVVRARAMAHTMQPLIVPVLTRLVILTLDIVSAVWVTKTVIMQPAFVRARNLDGEGLLEPSSGPHTSQLSSDIIYRVLAARSGWMVVFTLAAPCGFVFLMAGGPKTTWHGVSVFSCALPAIGLAIFLLHCNAVTMMGRDSPVNQPYLTVLTTVLVFLSWCPVVCGSQLWQRWYGIVNVFKMISFWAVQLGGLWCLFVYFLLPIYPRLPVQLLVLSKIALGVFQAVVCRLNFFLALSLRASDGSRTADHSVLAIFVASIYYVGTLYTRTAQLTKFSIQQTVIIESVSSVVQCANQWTLLEGKPPAQRQVDLAKWLHQLIVSTGSRLLPTLKQHETRACHQGCGKTAGNPSAMSFSSRSSPCKSTIDPSAGMPGQTQRVEQEVLEQDMSEDTEMHRLCVFTSLSIMVFDLTASIQVAAVIFIWNLTFDESATFPRRAIAQKMAITVACDLILTDLSVMLGMAYKCTAAVRRGIYKLDIVGLWRQSLWCWRTTSAFLLSPIYTVVIFVMLLQFSYPRHADEMEFFIVRETDASTIVF